MIQNQFLLTQLNTVHAAQLTLNLYIDLNSISIISETTLILNTITKIQKLFNMIVSLSAAVFKNFFKIKTSFIYKNSWKMNAVKMWTLKIKVYFQFYEMLTNQVLSNEAKITVTADYLKNTVKIWWLWKKEWFWIEEDSSDVRFQNMNEIFFNVFTDI